MMKTHQFETRLAECEADIRAAQRLRYEVFVEEMGARLCAADHAERLERDRFDAHVDHLLLLDGPKVVGAYRLMRADMAAKGIGFYSAAEFDLSKLQGQRALELGRSCIAKAYRGGVGLHLLWDALGDYVTRHKIDILFGVASFHGTEVAPLKQALTYLHHKSLAPEDLRVRSKAYVTLDQMAWEAVDQRAAVKDIPALIRAYLRLGGFVGDGAFIDHGFNTVDVCLIMDTARMVRRYKDYYSKERR
jgi:putative hemolysin